MSDQTPSKTPPFDWSPTWRRLLVAAGCALGGPFVAFFAVIFGSSTWPTSWSAEGIHGAEFFSVALAIVFATGGYMFGDPTFQPSPVTFESEEEWLEFKRK